MHKVDQTDLSFVTGNCFHAAVATVLGLTLDDLPNFSELDEQACADKTWGWFGPWRRWFAEHKVGWLYYRFSNDVPPKRWHPRLEHGQLVLIGGLSPRAADQGVHHSVVARYVINDDGTEGIVYCHDPHPDRTFIAGEPFDMFVLWRQA